MGWRWKDIFPLMGLGMFILGTVGAAVLLGVNLHWRYMQYCSFFEGSPDCMESDKYAREEEQTWRGYTTAVGLVGAGSGLVYISSKRRRRRRQDKRDILDLGEKLWIMLIAAGFVCLFAGYYLRDNIEPLWAWQNWYVHVAIDALLSVVWLLWIVAFGVLLIMRSEWVLPMIRSKR